MIHGWWACLGFQYRGRGIVVRVKEVFAVIAVISSAATWSPARAAEPVQYTLPDIISLTLARNPAMTGAQGLVDQRTGQRIAAGAYLNPSITGYGGHGMIRDAGRADIADSLTRQSLTEYNVMIGQPLEWPSKRAARKQAAEAGFAGSTYGLEEMQLNLVSDVKVAFYELLLALRDSDLAKQNVTIVEDVRRIVGVRVRLGEAPQFELVKAEVELLKANQAVTRAENTVRVSRVMLDTLTVGALGEGYKVSGEFALSPASLDLPTLIGRAMRAHPMLNRLSKHVEQADRSMEFERQARIPNVTVNGAYFREIGRESYMAGLSVPTPIWYQQQGEIAASLGVKRREEAELIRARNELVRQVNQFYQEAQTTSKLIEVLEKGLLKQAEEALRIAKFSFQQGAASLLEVLDAQRVQRQIMFDYAQARFELSVALARLERAVGGTL
jgi:outer membrane protein, heavy metal efflux system